MKRTFIIRLDDASDKMNVKKWNKMEELLDKYGIKPIVGIIPDNEDLDFQHYEKDNNFNRKVNLWQKKGWILAMHGYKHIFNTWCGGINPINKKSEFAGLDLVKQKEMIKKGYSLLKKKGVVPKIFFAPAHTFDENTLIALKEETPIRIVSDTIANRPYKYHGITFIPQQSGKVRNLLFLCTTFCYHPNEMNEQDFKKLNNFIEKNQKKFSNEYVCESNRNISLYDILLKKIYFLFRSIKKSILR